MKQERKPATVVTPPAEGVESTKPVGEEFKVLLSSVRGTGIQDKRGKRGQALFHAGQVSKPLQNAMVKAPSLSGSATRSSVSSETSQVKISSSFLPGPI
jgi:hypothetical protein